MRGTICLIIFAATVDIHTGDGSIIMQIQPGVHWYMERHSVPDMQEA